ncbi:hypothetical protein [Streptomyces sp. NPDC060194]|uniref:hypothetical protein n=1 Tax=Streptomyces sp. NPDC060194 TaxID=3347069 RepID=UPI00365B0BCA
MRRRLLHVLAWLLATGAAVSLSWWGVHTVMTGTVYDPPRALPVERIPARVADLPSATSATRAPADRPAASKSSPSPTGSGKPATGAGAKRSAAPSPRATADPTTAPAPTAAPSADPGDVRTYPLPGGRVVLDVTPTHCELVTATPAAGWSMQVWKQPAWLRVTFERGDRESSVICSWNAHAPLVETDERTR